MQPRYNLRDLRMLDLPDCDARITLALVSIARGINRAQLRVLFHQFDFRFMDAEYTIWRQVVFSASRLSDEAKAWPIDNFTDQTDAETIAQLRKLRSEGVTRSEARIEYGLAFTDSDW